MGRKKDYAPGELEKQLQNLREKFQIMTMKKVEYNQKLKIENQKLKKRLDEAKKELDY
jgi:regulator of replication initiation timing